MIANKTGGLVSLRVGVFFVFFLLITSLESFGNSFDLYVLENFIECEE